MDSKAVLLISFHPKMAIESQSRVVREKHATKLQICIVGGMKEKGPTTGDGREPEGLYRLRRIPIAAMAFT